MNKGILLLCAIALAGVVISITLSKKRADAPAPAEVSVVEQVKPVTASLVTAPAARPRPKAPPADPPQAPSIRDLLAKGDTKAAVTVLENLLQTDPNNAFALDQLGRLYAKDPAQKDRASQLLKKALESNPENRGALEEFLSLQRDPQKAGGPLQALQQLMEENPDSPNIAGAYARTLMHKGQYAEAAAVLERGIDSPYADPKALETLSELYSKMGEPGRTAQVFERTIQKQEDLISDLKSKNQPTADAERALSRSQRMLVEEFIRSRQLDRAEGVIKAIEARNPNHPVLNTLREDLQRARNI